MKKALILAAVVLAAPLIARADGVRDFVISPFTGFTINTPGSYRLTSDATMAANVAAINVFVGPVTIDLNGHTLTGDAESGGDGIVSAAAGPVNVRNGTVRAFSGNGVVLLAQGCSVSDLLVTNCTGAGLSTGARGKVRRVHCISNLTTGIEVGNESTVEDSMACDNNLAGSYAGIKTGAACIIRNCIANSNSAPVASGSAIGIDAGTNSTVENCTAISNYATGAGDAVGIRTGGGCTVTGNRADDNVAGSTSNSGIGISVGQDCIVSGNICNSNISPANNHGVAIGIRTQENCIVENNVCNKNSAGGALADCAGIVVAGRSTVRGNKAAANNGSGFLVGISTGIRINGTGSRVEGNNCSLHTGASTIAGGIHCDGDHNFVRGNSSSGNSSGGIVNSGSTNHFQENVAFSEIQGFGEFGSLSTFGTGDLANQFHP